MINKEDEWHDIPGFDNYCINRNGEIKIKKSGKTMAKDINNGYERVKLRGKEGRKNKKVHRLLAEVFIPNENPDIYTQVNHIDGNKRNNSLENLEWCTAKHNMQHAISSGLHIYGPNPNAGRSHRPVKIVETGKEYESMSECARQIKGDPNKIQDCLSGRQKTHRGYHFIDA